MMVRGLVPSPTFAVFHRFRLVGGRVVVTNLEGGWLVLSPEEFASFAEGKVDPASDLYGRLAAGNFLRASFDLDTAAERLRARKRFLAYGPNLHILVVTLRCNQTCSYCQASRAAIDAPSVDMTPETADRVLERAFATTNPQITLEFQGGEPLAHFDVVRHAIEGALERNKTAGKQLDFSLVTNLSLMDEDKLAYLLDRRVQICTSNDGPPALHDLHRKLAGGSSFQQAARWIRRIGDAYAAAGLDPTLYHVEALLTVTRDTLPRWQEVVDTYVELGCRALFLRPVAPFGFVDRAAERVSCSPGDYLEFYRRVLDAMLERNAAGVEILERYAALFLTKILAGEDPNFLDVRSPCGAGIGQLAYNYDGKVFTCDEGRMLHEMGDSLCLLGDVASSSYREIVGHETVRAMTIASNLDGQPDCVRCAYQPYCGVCPVHNLRTQGSIFGRMSESTWCAVHKGIQDYLFERIGEGRPEVLATFQRWTTRRSRVHFVHGPGR
jgi:uncharacterized protein